MPRIPTPTKDPGRDRWRCRLAGKWILGRTKDECAAKLAEAMNAAGHPATRRPDVPFIVTELIERWKADFPAQAAKHDDCVLQSLIDFASPADGPVALADVDRLFLARYADWLKSRTAAPPPGAKATRRKLAPATIRRRLYAAHGILEYAADQGWLQVAVKFDTKKVGANDHDFRGLSQAELTALFTGMDTIRREFARRVFAFMVYTGARPQEAVNLRWPDVDLDNRTVTLGHHKTKGKTGLVRTVYLSDECVALLRDLPEVEGVNHVFVSHKTREPYTTDGLRATLRRVAAECIGYEICPYRFRHTFAHNARRAGVQPDVLQKMMGHTNISTTLIYYRLEDEEVRKVAAGLHAAVRLDACVRAPQDRLVQTRRRVAAAARKPARATRRAG